MMAVARRWAPWLLLLAVAATVLLIGLQGSGGRPTLDAQVSHIANEVRCPVCDGETVAQSEAAPSVEIRTEIRQDLQRGQSADQILSSIVASYGPGILEKPPASGISLVVWVVPVAALIIGGGGLAFVFVRWRRGPAAGRAADRGDLQAVTEAPTGAGSAEPAAPAVPHGPADPSADAGSAEPLGRRRTFRNSRILVGCAGAALVAGGAGWAVAASSGTRLPGQEISGQALGSEVILADLQSANQYEDKNDALDAIKEYQKVLDVDPVQIQALTGEGWLLCQTGEPSLLAKGLSLLSSAEREQPGYAPAHVYRGIALLGESDYSDSIPELEWYLDHDPGSPLTPEVRTALGQAEKDLPVGNAPGTGSGAPSGS